MLHKVYLGLGSNLGDREGNIAEAVKLLGRVSSGVVVSSLYQTAPQGFTSQPPFVNAACRIWTGLDPVELLEHLKGIQARVGSRRPFINGPRALDIDILTFAGWVIGLPGLVVPHPRMAEREFVLAPLAEIAPSLLHPVLKQTITALLAQLPATGAVRKFVAGVPSQGLPQ